MKEVVAFYPILIDGTITTIILTVLSSILALVISFVVGLSRISKFKIVRILAIIYLEFFRGSSALVQMFFIYFVLPMWGIYFDSLTAGVIAIGCNLGAYGSEVVRGGVLAVGKEQHEASLALNYSPYKRYRHVIIPQAIPVMIPTFGNLQIELLKLTAVASLITISDLTFMAHIIRVQTALTLEPFLVILVIYFIIASVLVKIVDLIAKRFSKGILQLLKYKEPYVIIAIVGLICSYGLQSLINIFSTLGIIPTKGMTLPFISYGGSSMVSSAILFGFLLSLTKQHK